MCWPMTTRRRGAVKTLTESCLLGWHATQVRRTIDYAG
jgi:hypothetical protein